jgi:hypothetical protein
VAHRRSPAIRLLVLAGLFAIGVAGRRPIALADEKGTQKNKQAKATPSEPAKAGADQALQAIPGVSLEREAAAIEFAQKHHPEVASLLKGLKQNAPKEYRAALVDLDRTVERLEKLREKTPERYEFQLAEWKITSRIRLLGARLAMSDDPAVEDELRTALRQRLTLRLDAQRVERDRLQKRVERLDESIGELSSRTDALVEKQLTELRSKPTGENPAKRKQKQGAADEHPEEEEKGQK